MALSFPNDVLPTVMHEVILLMTLEKKTKQHPNKYKCREDERQTFFNHAKLGLKQLLKWEWNKTEGACRCNMVLSYVIHFTFHLNTLHAFSEQDTHRPQRQIPHLFCILNVSQFISHSGCCHKNTDFYPFKQQFVFNHLCRDTTQICNVTYLAMNKKQGFSPQHIAPYTVL